MRALPFALLLIVSPVRAQDLFGMPVDPPDTKKQWPNGPLKDYLEKLQRPDSQLYGDMSPLSCCGAGDVVETKFKVEPGGGPYPNDTWYALLKGEWVKIPRNGSCRILHRTDRLICSCKSATS